METVEKNSDTIKAFCEFYQKYRENLKQQPTPRRANNCDALSFFKKQIDDWYQDFDLNWQPLREVPSKDEAIETFLAEIEKSAKNLKMEFAVGYLPFSFVIKELYGWGYYPEYHDAVSLPWAMVRASGILEIEATPYDFDEIFDELDDWLSAYGDLPSIKGRISYCAFIDYYYLMLKWLCLKDLLYATDNEFDRLLNFFNKLKNRNSEKRFENHGNRPPLSIKIYS